MKPTLHSVSYAGLWGQQSLGVSDFIKKAATLGYEAVELMGKRPHLSPVDVSEEYLEDIKNAAQKSNVTIAVIAAYNDFTQTASLGTPIAEMQLAYIKDLLKMGAYLGASSIRLFTGYHLQDQAYFDDWKVCVKAVRECAAMADDYGLKIGIQNHHDTGIAFETYSEFLQDVDRDNCYAMFDPWAPALHGDDLYKCAKIMAPQMIHTTLADYVKLRHFSYMPELVNYRKNHDIVRAVPLGEGFVDLEAFFRGLTDGGFEGTVAYEMCSPLRGGGKIENLDKCAKKSLDVIRACIRKARKDDER